MGSFMYVVRHSPAIRAWLMRLSGSGGYYASVSSCSEASPPAGRGANSRSTGVSGVGVILRIPNKLLEEPRAGDTHSQSESSTTLRLCCWLLVPHHRRRLFCR